MQFKLVNNSDVEKISNHNIILNSLYNGFVVLTILIYSENC